MTTHELKCWPAFFDAVRRGEKTFELRRNDRGFQRGDVLVLRKWDPHAGVRHYDFMKSEYGPPEGDYVDEPELRMLVTYVLSSEHLKEGCVALGITTEPPGGDKESE